MKVLFVFSGNHGKNEIVNNQANSLISCGIEVVLFPIMGKGLWGYLANLGVLRKISKKVDLVHAHFSLAGFLATLSLIGTKKKVICSLMGSDILNEGLLFSTLVRFFSIFFWDYTIVKSKEMLLKLHNYKNAQIVPNGVDIDKFYPIDKSLARSTLGLKQDAMYLIFPSNPARLEKNYKLFNATVEALRQKGFNVQTICYKGIPNDQLFYYYSAADLLLFTSYYEGSPNVIKEAMACNCPIVSTDVGDVKEIINKTLQCKVVNFDIDQIIDSCSEILSINSRSNGRINIHPYESAKIAVEISRIYFKCINAKI